MCSWKVKNLFFRGDIVNYNIDYGCGGDKSYYDNDEVDSTLCQKFRISADVDDLCNLSNEAPLMRSGLNASHCCLDY